MVSKGLRATSVSAAKNFEVDYDTTHTIEILIGYTNCCAFMLYFIHFQSNQDVLIHFYNNLRKIMTFLLKFKFTPFQYAGQYSSEIKNI